MSFAIIKSLPIPVLALTVASCNTDKSTPGYTYMDDMYRSPGLETYQATDLFENGAAARTPIEGTVARGSVPYELENSNEGYMQSLTDDSAVPDYFASLNPDDGKELYNIFCSHCHGEKGDGIGILVEREKILGVPGYGADRLPDITPASAYHVIMYGKGMMGSHASQLNYDERWKVIRYVWKLRAEQSGMEDVSAQAEDEVAPEATTEEMEEQA